MENTHVNESILSAEILEDQKKNRIDHMKYLKGMEDIGSEVLDKVVSEMEPMIMLNIPKQMSEEHWHTVNARRRISRHFYHRQLCRCWKKSPRQPRWRRESISETASICSLRFTLQTTVRIIVFIVDSTATIRSTVHS